MAKKKAFKAAIARRKAARVKVKHIHKPILRYAKDRDAIHASMTHCCIPQKVKNPNISVDKDGNRVLNYNLDALNIYHEMKAKWQKWNKRSYPDVVVYKHGRLLYHRNRRSPWYMATKGKQYRYASKTYNWGMMSSWIRVKSELGVFHSKSIVPKMTRAKYNDLLIEAKLKDWEKKHPRPIPKDDAQKDLFEAQFMVPWIDEHTKAREKIKQFVENIGNRVIIFARYVGDVGYPRKVTEIKSDNKPFLIMDGKYNNYDSKVVNTAQKLANDMKKTNQKLIALKIVEGNKQCIVIPYVPIEEQIAKIAA